MVRHNSLVQEYRAEVDSGNYKNLLSQYRHMRDIVRKRANRFLAGAPLSKTAKSEALFIKKSKNTPSESELPLMLAQLEKYYNSPVGSLSRYKANNIKIANTLRDNYLLRDGTPIYNIKPEDIPLFFEFVDRIREDKENKIHYGLLAQHMIEELGDYTYSDLEELFKDFESFMKRSQESYANKYYHGSGAVSDIRDITFSNRADTLSKR